MKILDNESHYTDNPDVDVVGEIMSLLQPGKWSNFSKVFPTKPVCRHVILNTYQYYPYYKQTMKLFGVRDKTKRDIFINLIKLNSEKSKELFQKWLNKSKIEDNLTLKVILEKGYQGDSISQSCYDYYDLSNLSLDELVNS
ncbi:7877_t:CDS:1 [Entrophospora sp. SA101]|nr:7877_t:CDS:1 [Entrophospora sp. SA101]